MRYLITHPSHKPFLSKHFDPAIHWMEGQVVFDLHEYKFMSDRYTWEETPIDSL